jgi:hypothetical protein
MQQLKWATPLADNRALSKHWKTSSNFAIPHLGRELTSDK